ncbi:hypothetical protein ACOHYD_05490 [Desulfobacterota bacterium M19]
MLGLNNLLDKIYYGTIVPLFAVGGRVLYFIFIQPMAYLDFPVWLQICVLAALVALCSFALRHLLRVDEKIRSFNARFAEKREQQQALQLITDKYSREALYRITDEDLNAQYNYFLAHHYARYVIIYMLPIFLVLAWLNQVYSAAVLGNPFVITIPANDFGVQGLSVTFLFLLTYVICLIIGFRLLRKRHLSQSREQPLAT